MLENFSPNLRLVETLDDAFELKRWLGERRPVLGIDTETTGLHWWTPHFLRTVQFGDPQTGWTVPFEWWGKLIRDIYDALTEPVVYHNAKFDLHALSSQNIYHRPGVKIHDTKLMSWLLNPPVRHGLKPLSAEHIDKYAGMFEKQLNEDKAKHKWDWATTPVNWPSYWMYAATDPVFTSALAELFWPQINARGLRSAYEQELHVSDIAFQVETSGMKIDVPYIISMREQCWEKREAARIFLDRCGVDKPGSLPLIRAALQAEGWEPDELTPTGEPALNKNVLKGLDSEIADAVLEYRKYHKFCSSYFDNFLEMRSGDYLHATINTCQARTGRMSVTEPALQTLTKGKEVRDAFIAEEDHVLISVDYSQIELRLLAHFADEKKMKQAFADGRDLHSDTASLLYGSSYTKQQRSICKNGNFSLVYGAQPEKFSTTAGCTLEEAEEFFRQYNATYTGVSAYMNFLQQQAHDQLTAGEKYAYVDLYDGVRLPAKKDKEYTLLNYEIQGTAAKVLKSAAQRLDNLGLTQYLRMLVHDENIFSVPKNNAEEICKEIEEVMVDNTFSVPLTVESKILTRWGDAFDA